jgi:Bacterial lectin
MARFGSLRSARPMAVRRIVPLAVAVTMVVGLSLTATAPAQTGSAWHTVGNATLQADRLVLTESLFSRAGAAWQVPAVKLPNKFKARFDFALSQSQGAADGFAFVIQGASVDALGGLGGGLGYTGIPNSIAVEFDTFRNPPLADPAVPHISIHTRGPQPNDVDEQYSLGVSVVPFLSNGARHSVIIRYRRHMLSVTLDGQEKLNVPINLRKRLELRRRRVWFGFTAATGASRQRHEILSYRLNRGGDDDEDSPSDDDDDSPSDDDNDSPSDDDDDSPSDDDDDSPADDDDD